MFHGVDVAIFDVAAIAVIVPDQMPPETALPDAPFTARPTNSASPLGRRHRLGEDDLISRQRVEKSVSPSGRVQIA
jgi:hypothetical protein